MKLEDGLEKKKTKGRKWPKLDFNILKKNINPDDIQDFIKRNEVLEECYGYHNSSQIEEAKDKLAGKGELLYEYVAGKLKMIL